MALSADALANPLAYLAGQDAGISEVLSALVWERSALIQPAATLMEPAQDIRPSAHIPRRTT